MSSVTAETQIPAQIRGQVLQSYISHGVVEDFFDQTCPLSALRRALSNSQDQGRLPSVLIIVSHVSAPCFKSQEEEVDMNQFFTPYLVIAIGVVLSVPPMALAQSFPPVVTQKIQVAQKQVKTIGLEEYRKVVASPGDALIVDVREPHEYAAGHVPGAINIPRGLVEFQIWKHVGFPATPEMDRPLYLQCQSGNRASLAAQSLAELGFTHTTAVVMSLEEWQKAGNPLAK